MRLDRPRVIIAGVTSASGKTTVTTGLIGALVRRGVSVQAFKTGPDYIDPSYHTAASGRPSRNLDSWLLDPPALVEFFARAATPAQVTVIEGVMGLFDGRNGGGEEGSTAHLAKLTRTPVLLVIDVGKTSRSAAATVLGFRDFDPDLPLAGVILNQVGSETHDRWVTEAIETLTGLPVVGRFPKQPELGLPERHLGLVPVNERRVTEDWIALLGETAAGGLDLAAIDRIMRSAPPLDCPETGLFPPEPRPAAVRLGVAQDEAFGFYYADTLDLLAAWGAELVPVSPLRDRGLPTGLDGLYLGGGFPEEFASELAANTLFLTGLRAAAVGESGRAGPLLIYAECGGLMYLSQGIETFDGQRYPLAGLVPGWSVMRKRRVSLGYRAVAGRPGNFLLGAGESVRGHEFHWSELAEPLGEDQAAYRVTMPADRPEGFLRGRLLASYIHLHFGSRASLAPNLIAALQSSS
ncbi:MAG TPA: cobyrinate a,c-diamide synthase [Dehalococcoidia bacterium]|nr:cobyrinate a,c-diamide synthase [Dehalococcoidia bacterium]